PDLLAYLVRRLLENGANTSFVNRFMDERVPIDQVVADPFEDLERAGYTSHPRIPVPLHLFGNDRLNSQEADFGDVETLDSLTTQLHEATGRTWSGGSLIGGERRETAAAAVVNPADRRIQVGSFCESTPAEIEEAFTLAAAAQPEWNSAGAE